MAGSAQGSLPRRVKIQREGRGRRTRCDELDLGSEATRDTGPVRVARARWRPSTEIHEVVVDVLATVCCPRSHTRVQRLGVGAGYVTCQSRRYQGGGAQQQPHSS